MQNPPSTRARTTTGTILTVLQLAGLAALLVWAIQLKRELGRAETEIASLRQRPAPAPADNLRKENQALRSQIAALETEVATMAVAAAAKPASTPAPATVTPAAPANPMAALAATLNNPAMIALRATSQKRALETRFAELFSQLQFTPEQRARFLDVAYDATAPLTDAALKLAAGNLSPAEQAAIRQSVEEGGKTVDGKIREFLGDEAKFAIYQQYQEQQTERTQINALKTSLAQAGEPALSAEQSRALTEIMYAERKSFPLTPTPRDAANPLAAPPPEAIATRLREQEQLQNRIAERASAILNTEQLAALRRENARRLETLKASSEVARQMLGGAQAPAK
jgi:hypothetical protein